jgi:hypothetical protein
VSEFDDASMLPPKREIALALVQTATSVFIHLDPRALEVNVPSWFKNQPELVLQIGLNLVPPIVDLDIGEDALSATLSFNRRPEHCRIPWAAIWGLVGDDGRGMIWPESVPPEVAARAPGRTSTAGKSPSAGRPTRKGAGGHLRAADQPALERPKERGDGAAALPQPKPSPTAVDGGGASAGTTPRKRELPPYLRIVK